MRERTDKSFPNGLNTAKGVINSIKVRFNTINIISIVISLFQKIFNSAWNKCILCIYIIVCDLKFSIVCVKYTYYLQR